MANIAEFQKEAIKLRYVKRPIIQVQGPEKRMYVRHEYGDVVIYSGDSLVRLSTIVAHKMGMAINSLVQKIEPDALIELAVSGQSLKMEPRVAMKVAGAILKKADDADDYQLQHRRVLQ